MDVENRAVGAGLYLSASPVFLRRLLTSRPLARRTLVRAGYAGWGAKQLESELAQGAWLTVDVTPALIFDTPAEKMWEQALRSLGIDPSSLVPGVGVH